MKEAQKNYTLKYTRHDWVENWRACMENHTGFDVTIIRYSDGKIGIGIDRCGFFIFRDKSVLIDSASGAYISEKLHIFRSDAECLIDFFRHTLDGDTAMVSDNYSNWLKEEE